MSAWPSQYLNRRTRQRSHIPSPRPKQLRFISCRNARRQDPRKQNSAPQKPSVLPTTGSPSGNRPLEIKLITSIRVVNALVQPPVDHLINIVAYRRILPVQVHLLFGKGVHSPTVHRFIIIPGRTGEQALQSLGGVWLPVVPRQGYDGTYYAGPVWRPQTRGVRQKYGRPPGP